MLETVDVTLSVEECGQLERMFRERSRRVSALLQLDQVLGRAASRHNLAAEIVRHGWPHRAD